MICQRPFGFFLLFLAFPFRGAAILERTQSAAALTALFLPLNPASGNAAELRAARGGCGSMKPGKLESSLIKALLE